MPLISIITATHPAGAGFLNETLDGVRNLLLPPGWELEWIVQEDGPASDAADLLSGLDNVKYAATGTKFGPAHARNLALSRSTGQLIRNLDADDLLLPNALERLIPLFDEHSEVHWAVSQADDLLPDGSRQGFPPDLPFGRVPAGAVNEWAERHGGNWPIHCAGLTARTSSVRAIGGWAAVPADEDIVMFAALSEVTDGWFDEAITWLYRQHAGQTVRSGIQAWGEISRRIALQRARAVRLAGLGLNEIGVDPDPHIEMGAPMKEFIPVTP